MYLTSPAGAQIFLDDLVVLNLLLDNDLLWQIWSGSVVLLEKRLHYRAVSLSIYAAHVVVFPADHLAGSYEEYGYDTLISKIGGHGDHIPVVCACVTDSLGGLNVMDALYQIPDLGGLFKFHILGQLLHLLFEIPDHMTVVAVQKAYGILDIFVVILLGDISLTGRHALLYLVIQAGPFKAHIPWQNLVAAPDVIQLFQQLYDILHRFGIGVWAEIFGVIPFHLMAVQYARVILIHSNADIGITLVIREHGVVMRSVLLYKVAL